MTQRNQEEDSQTNLTLEELEKLSEEDLRRRLAMLDQDMLVKKAVLKKMAIEAYHLKHRLEENKFILRAVNRPPYVVATVNQLWDDRDDDVSRDSASTAPSTSTSSDYSGSTTTGASSWGSTVSDATDNNMVIKTSTRRMLFFGNGGTMVPPGQLQPGMEVCVNKDTGVVVSILPEDIDPKVRKMVVMEKPVDLFSDVGGLETQIQELMEAVVLPQRYPERFAAVGVSPPRGVLLYGPPGTGKTMLARACAANTSATFIKLCATHLLQHYIGDGAKLVREVFKLARQQRPSIVFIDELDAIGSKRDGSGRGKPGEREVQRTMLELLNQMDGFGPEEPDVIVIAATNRIDMLDPALIRSGRFDKKIEIPEPDQVGRLQVLQIHTRKMELAADVQLEELARVTEGFSAAMCRALCTEAAMVALRRDATSVCHEDFVQAVTEVTAARKGNLSSYA